MAPSIGRSGRPSRAPRRDDLDGDGIRLALEQRSFYRFSLIATQINRAIASAYVKRFGRPANAWKVMTVVGRFGAMSTAQVQSLTTLEGDKITRIVDALVARNLAVRRQDTSDRRRVIISLSVSGKRLNASIEDMITHLEHEFLDCLDRDEREAFYDMLDRLQLRANKIFNDPPAIVRSKPKLRVHPISRPSES